MKTADVPRFQAKFSSDNPIFGVIKHGFLHIFHGSIETIDELVVTKKTLPGFSIAICVNGSMTGG